METRGIKNASPIVLAKMIGVEVPSHLNIFEHIDKVKELLKKEKLANVLFTMFTNTRSNGGDHLDGKFEAYPSTSVPGKNTVSETCLLILTTNWSSLSSKSL